LEFLEIRLIVRCDRRFSINTPQDEALSVMPIRNGHVEYESGHHGDQWLELELLFLKPGTMFPLCRELAKRLVNYNVDSVCGALTEGAFVALHVATELRVEFSYAVRSDSGRRDTLYPIEYRIPGALRKKVRGKRVAIVNDVINAGSAVRGTYLDLLACDAEPVVIGALWVRGDAFPLFANERDIALESLAVSQSNLWTPSECPLCAANVKLERIADF
jgi:orotate phosphoribosyltransferase